MRFWVLAAATLIFSFKDLKAQISSPGVYRHLVQATLQKSGALSNFVEYNLPEQDNAQLLAQAEADEAVINAKATRQGVSSDGTEEVIYADKPPKAAPYQFGKAIDFVVEMDKESQGNEWIVNEENGTRMWRFKVHSKDAHSISIYFSDFYLAPSSELYIIGKEETLGAFTSQNNKEDRLFGIAPVAGDFLILEYIEPLNIIGNSSIIVSHFVHGFRPSPFSMKADNAAGNCHFNVACPEGSGKTNAINSVALLINGKGDSFCTGAMVNNLNQDARQLFLTAEHCIGSTDVKNFMIGFHYQFKYCNSAFESKPMIKTVHGTKLLDKSDVSDYALLEVIESIPDEWDVFMAGWDATGLASRTGSFYGIHHPRGDTKKVSLYQGKLDMVRLTEINNGVNFWRVAKWDKGVTEPGSSGSPLFNSNGLIIGHLLGGESACNRQNSPDYYGALSRDWILPNRPIIRHLNPQGINETQVSGAPLRQLRNHEEQQMPQPTMTEPVDTITVTQTLYRTLTETATVAKTTQTITSRFTVTAPGERVTSTKEVTNILTATVTKTETFTRIPPPVTIVRTVTVKNKKN